MTPSALLWFVDLCTRYAAAPSEAKLLGVDIAKQLRSKSQRVQINRVFDRHATSLPSIYAWLSDAEMVTVIESGGCSITKYTYKLTVDIIQEILGGELASKAWGMCKRRGVVAGFSATLEAAALVGYLTKITGGDWLPENIDPASELLSKEYLLLAYIFQKRPYHKGNLFSQTSALRIASKLFDINEDNVRQYAGIDPCNAQSEAGIALFALAEKGLLPDADRYFDVEELVEAIKRPIQQSVLEVALAPD